MGYSLTQYNVETAKKEVRSKRWVVFEASTVRYFDNKKWVGAVVEAQVRDTNGDIHFTLKNGDFVTVEKDIPYNRPHK